MHGVYCNTEQRRGREKRIAEFWTSDEVPIISEDVSCYGCLPDGKIMTKFCFVCVVRKCALEKEVENCAFCHEYPGEQINQYLEVFGDTEAKKTLEKIRKDIDTNESPN